MSLLSVFIFSSLLISLGMLGMVINRKNLIMLLMCLELMLLGVNTAWIACAQARHDAFGHVMVLVILSVAACEAAIGLAILVVLFRQRQSIHIEQMNQLQG